MIMYGVKILLCRSLSFIKIGCVFELCHKSKVFEFHKNLIKFDNLNYYL